MFPHHENELAQSSALGHRFATIWMHNGMLELGAEKMSKSLGNVVTLRNVLDTWGREALLVFHLTGHWSKPVDFSDEAMEAASARARRGLSRGLPRPERAGGGRMPGSGSQPRSTTTSTRRRRSPSCTSGATTTLLRRALDVFGLESLAEDDEAPPEVVALAERRVEARAARDFDAADASAQQIEAAGWDVRDEADGFRLVRRR